MLQNPPLRTLPSPQPNVVPHSLICCTSHTISSALPNTFFTAAQNAMAAVQNNQTAQSIKDTVTNGEVCAIAPLSPSTSLPNLTSLNQS